jgi:hypothetical protein
MYAIWPISAQVWYLRRAVEYRSRSSFSQVPAGRSCSGIERLITHHHRVWQAEQTWSPGSVPFVRYNAPHRPGPAGRRNESAQASTVQSRHLLGDLSSNHERSASRRRLRRRWPGVSAGLSLSRGPPGARRATCRQSTDQNSSYGTAAGCARGRHSRLRLSRSRPPRQDRLRRRCAISVAES